MSKLLKLKEWVTIPDAAKHLTQIFNEPFSEADIFQLALDEHITLSVVFPNQARAQIGKVIPFKDVPLRELPLLQGGEPRFFPDGRLLNDFKDGESLNEDTPFIHFDKTVKSIDGIWDLSMTGGERIDIEFQLHQLIGGPEVTMISLDGTFLNRKDGTWASLQAQFEDSFELQDDGRKKRVPGSFYPAGGLGDDCKLVVRTSELLRLHVNQEEPATDRPLEIKERRTLLCIIAALCKEAGLDYKKAAKTAGLIQGTAQQMGVSLGETTIEGHLKKIPDALATRMK
jgi:hypothetical protein